MQINYVMTDTTDRHSHYEISSTYSADTREECDAMATEWFKYHAENNGDVFSIVATEGEAAVYEPFNVWARVNEKNDEGSIIAVVEAEVVES